MCIRSVVPACCVGALWYLAGVGWGGGGRGVSAGLVYLRDVCIDEGMRECWLVAVGYALGWFRAVGTLIACWLLPRKLRARG